MAGYSGTPLPKKLGVKEGHRLVLLNAPAGFAEAMAPLPDGVRLSRSLGRESDIIVLFAKSQAVLSRQLPRALARIGPSGAIWIAWPKQSSGVRTDLSDNAVREIGLTTGLVDTKVCAVDGVWSGLRFVVRLKDREAWARKPGT
jgi:hypothetical protein